MTTTEQTDHPSLAHALAAFQGEMPTVTKDKTAQVGTYSYRYADLADLVNAAAPIMSRHGLSFTAKTRVTEHGLVIVGVLRHTSGGRDKSTLPINGSTPQALGSAITYARRYMFGCMTGMVTDDDDDGATAQRQATAPAARTTATRTMSRQPKPDPDPGITDDQMKLLHKKFNDLNITDRDMRLAYCTNLLGHEVTTSKELTKAEASRVIDALAADADAMDPWSEPA